MPIPHDPHAPTNPFAPEPVGICDRCGFKFPLASLVNQRQWAGPAIIKTNILVCPPDLDDLQQNGFRTIVIGPDPKPLKHARPPSYKQQAGPTPPQFVLDDPADGLLDDGNVV